MLNNGNNASFLLYTPVSIATKGEHDRQKYCNNNNNNNNIAIDIP
jgi:hypothetical protein